MELYELVDEEVYDVLDNVDPLRAGKEFVIGIPVDPLRDGETLEFLLDIGKYEIEL